MAEQPAAPERCVGRLRAAADPLLQRPDLRRALRRRASAAVRELPDERAAARSGHADGGVPAVHRPAGGLAVRAGRRRPGRRRPDRGARADPHAAAARPALAAGRAEPRRHAAGRRIRALDGRFRPHGTRHADGGQAGRRVAEADGGRACADPRRPQACRVALRVSRRHADDGQRERDDRVGPRRPGRDRPLRRALMRGAGLAAVALLVAGAAILIGRYGVRVHTFNPDELFPVFGARHLQAHFPGGLFDAATSPRGLERLTAWMLAAVDAVTPSAASSLWVGRIVFAVSFAAVAPLAYWWARLLALPRAVAVACAALAVAGPWMVFGTSFLNVVPAWPLTTLALLAIWRGLTVPSARGDLLMLGAVVLLGLARVGNVVVAAAVPVGAIVIALRHTRSIGGSARLLWREHRVLVIAAALGLIVAAIAGRHALIGGYPVRTPAPDLDFLRQLRFGWEQVADGAALVPMIVATAWVLRSLVRPSDRAAEAFALVMGVAFLALSYAALTQAPEE